jgi:hypothetical protein
MKLPRTLSLVALVCGAGSGACTGQISSAPRRGSPEPSGPAGAPATPGVDVGACSAATLARPRAWRLTNAQLRNTLLDAVGFAPPTLSMLPGETRLDGFANQSDRLSIASLVADYYLRASDELASEVVRRSTELVKCPMASLGGGTCLADFVAAFGARLWRRPLLDSEVGRLTALYTTTAAQAGGPEAGLRTVVQGLFMSPNFLYRSEVGNTQAPGAVAELTQYEVASALSYMLWDSPPDATLVALAEQGKLRDRSVLGGEARRLLAAPKAQGAMHSFLQQWLQIEDLLTADKDPMVYSVYSPQVAADLMEETRLLLASVVFDPSGDRSFRTLFTSPIGFVNARTAPIYGLANVAGATLGRAMLDPAQRRGILTSGAFMAAHADGDDTGPVSRGRYFREELLCDGVPPPNPTDAMFDPQKITPDMTNRERLTAHATNPACKACHALFDGLGFAMENYDPIGRFRTTEKGKPIDPTGSVPLRSGRLLTFESFVDLVDQLARTPDLYQCFSTQYLSYATGRLGDQIDDCEKKRVAGEFERSGYKIDALVLSVVQSPSFIARRN